MKNVKCSTCKYECASYESPAKSGKFLVCFTCWKLFCHDVHCHADKSHFLVEWWFDSCDGCMRQEMVDEQGFHRAPVGPYMLIRSTCKDRIL